MRDPIPLAKPHGNVLLAGEHERVPAVPLRPLNEVSEQMHLRGMKNVEEKTHRAPKFRRLDSKTGEHLDDAVLIVLSQIGMDRKTEDLARCLFGARQRDWA